MVYRLILPDWAKSKNPTLRKVLEGQFTSEQLATYNEQGYNVYYLPNYPSVYNSSITVDGSHIDVFQQVFVDCDLKDGVYTKDSFIEKLAECDILPTKVVDSGNGIHAYWTVQNLDAMSYLRFQRRLMRLLNTDEAVGQIFQLMRLENTINTKHEHKQVPCEIIFESDTIYTPEELDKLLPPITVDDEKYCQVHYDKTYKLNQSQVTISDTLPPKFGKLLKDNAEVKSLFAGSGDDRSKNDFRLGNIMYAHSFTKDEAMSVLINSSKAMQRAPVHRASYAENIVNKIWPDAVESLTEDLSESVESLLASGDEETLKGDRIVGYTYIDNTDHGFRLGQVMGLVAGVGAGKTAISLNLFRGFVQNNPNQVHMFVSLEQPAREIAGRWAQLCQGDTRMHSKVHILGNYNKDGTYRNLSLPEIEEYVLVYEAKHKVKVGCVVVDNLNVLKKKSKNGENEGLIEVCQQLKSFAIRTNTFLIMQSQTNREKAGIGDLELNKDAAYGTQSFEAFLDYLLVCWQPLKRQYHVEGCPTITAIKFAKIRFKKRGVDKIQEDVRYLLYFDTDTGSLRPTTQDEDKSFAYHNSICANLRKQDRKVEIVPYTSVRFDEIKPGGLNAATINHPVNARKH